MKTIKTTKNNPRIAYVSDLHGFNKVNKITKSIEKENIELIVLGGDFTDYTIPGTQKVVNTFLKLNIPTIIITGSHENFEIHDKIIEKIKKSKYKNNLIDGLKNNYIRFGEYELIIINGSSSVVSGVAKMRGGSYYLIERGRDKKTVTKLASERLRETKTAKKATPIFMDDIFKMVERNKGNVTASKKIIFSHNPPLCKTRKGLDLAQFGIITERFKIKKLDLRRKEFKDMRDDGSFIENFILTKEETLILKEYGYPVKRMNKNVGSKEITTLMNKYNINKILCGHIHESGRRAIDKKEKSVKSNTWTRDVRINSGEGSKGQYTIIELGLNGKIKYNFIKANQ